MAAQALLAEGHRDIAVIGGPRSAPGLFRASEFSRPLFSQMESGIGRTSSSALAGMSG